MKHFIVTLALLFTIGAHAQGVGPKPGGSQNYKPIVANPAALPITGNAAGDVRVSLSDSSLYIWNGAAWGGVTGGGSAIWGSITGVLGAQTDLATALAGKEPTITAGTSLQYYRGDKTFQTLNTLAVPELTNLYYTQARFDTAFAAKSTTLLSEGTNLYFTNARAIAATLTGYLAGSGVVSSADSIISALQKLDGNISANTSAIALKQTGPISGDGTTPSNSSGVLTLATVNGSPGSFGDATHSLSATVNGKGLVTGLSTNLIQIPESQVTNLVSDLAGKEPTITATTSADYYRGDKTFQTLNTLAVPELTNLYFTNARTLASVLTGYTSGAGVLSAADTVLSAIQKLNGNIGAISGSAITSLTGDGTATGPGAAAFTLATVNATTGSFGSASSVPVTTVNGKGLTTNVVNTPIAITESQVTNLTSDLALKAPLASPSLTGTPTTPTATAGTNTTQIASTAFANAAATAAAAASQTGIYYHYAVDAPVVENDIVESIVNTGTSVAPLFFVQATNGGATYYPAIYGVAKNVSGGFADIYVGKNSIVPGFSFGAFIGVDYYIDGANPGKLTFTGPTTGSSSNPIKVGRAQDATHLILDPIGNFVQGKGYLYTSDGSYDSTFAPGTNGQVPFYNSAQPLGLQAGAAVVTAAPFTYTTSTRTLTAATATNAVAGILSAADHTTFAAKVDGPASSVDAEFALFNSTTGKLIKRATGTGVAHATSGVYSVSNVVLTSEVTGTLPVANGGTGITSLGAGIATFWGTPSSANLAAAITDETGSGLAVFNTAPTFATSVTLGTDAHLISTGTAPTTTVNSNAGTSATCTVSVATDVAGKIQLVTGSGSWVSGNQCAVNFNTTYGAAPKCTISPLDSTTASLTMQQSVNTSTTQLQVSFSDADLAATTYNWAYHCIQ